MADNVDEFILKYNVDIAEAMRKLDALNAKLEKTGKGSKESIKGVGSQIKGMAAGFAVAGAAIAAAAVTITRSIRSVTEAMKDYSEQANIARKTGLGAIAQDVIAANMSRASGGRVTRMDSRQAVNAIADTVNAAYTDPTRNNAQNIRLRMMGVSPVGANGGVASAGDVMDQLGKRWAKMTQEMAEAEAQLIGLTPQAADSIRNLAGAVTDTSGVTLEMATRQKEASEAAKKLNEAVNGMGDDFATMSKVITDDLMKPMSEFFKLLQEGTHNLASTFNKDGILGGIGHIGKALWSDLKERVGAGKDDKVRPFSAHLAATAKKETEEERAEVQKITSEQNEAAQLQHEAATKQELTANQFAASVAAMPGAVTMQQAFAMWAGEFAKGQTVGGAGVGGAASPAGVSAGGNTGSGAGASRGIRNNNPGNLEYGPFAKSQGATSSDGRFAIFPTMAAGVKAHETLLGGKRYAGKTLSGIINTYAPSSENDTKGYIDFLTKKTGIKAGDVVSPEQIPALAAAMQVMESGYRGGAGGGAAKPKLVGAMGLNEMQRLMASNGIANQLGMNPEQFQREGASRGDVQYGIDAQRKGLGLSITKLENEIKGYQAAGKPWVANQKEGELFRMRQQMQMLDSYAPSMLASARPGGQERTQGMPPIQITINGATDPVAVGNEVRRVMGQEMQKTLNQHANKTTN